MLAQRIYGLALGYEDINDHQRLRLDPLLATACNKTDPLGEDRLNPGRSRHRPGGALPRSTAWSCPTTRALAATSCRTTRPRSRLACCTWERVVCPSTPRKSWWIWTRWAIGCTACKRAGTSTPIMTIIVICRSTLSWGTFRCGRNCAPRTTGRPTGWCRRWRRSWRPFAALPQGADHRAWGQRFLPGGDHGLVRGAARGLLLLGLG